jgi:hypothetical protein
VRLSASLLDEGTGGPDEPAGPHGAS